MSLDQADDNFSNSDNSDHIQVVKLDPPKPLPKKPIHTVKIVKKKAFNIDTKKLLVPRS